MFVYRLALSVVLAVSNHETLIELSHFSNIRFS
jgi:hypothetical protein